MLAACGGTESRTLVSSRAAVISFLDLPTADSGVAIGFDLDGLVSDQSDGRTCYHPDLTSPDGLPGVDNQLATLLPLIDIAGEGAFGALINEAVTEGRLLLVFEIDEMDDGTYDVVMRRADDRPLLGTDGELLPDQTLALNGQPEIARVSGAERTGDTIDVGPLPLIIPVAVFDAIYEMAIPDGIMRIELDATGTVRSGLFGGGIPMSSLDSMMDAASKRLESDFLELLRNGVVDSMDMARTPEGVCDQLSMAMGFRAVGVHLFE